MRAISRMRLAAQLSRVAIELQQMSVYHIARLPSPSGWCCS
jgi:hypothetical protein